MIDVGFPSAPKAEGAPAPILVPKCVMTDMAGRSPINGRLVPANKIKMRRKRRGDVGPPTKSYLRKK